MKRIVVCCSGGGSNLQAVLDAIDAGRVAGRIVCVLLSRDGVYAKERARQRGIPVEVMPRRAFPDAADWDAAMLDLFRRYAPDFIVLAGYLSIFGAETVRAYAGRIINIHPALLPRFGGKGMYGERVHAAVLESGETRSGATVHFVDEGTDTGPILLQRSVPVLPGDDVHALAARVLEVEHKILPEALALLCEGRVSLQGGQVYIDGERRKETDNGETSIDERIR